MTELLIRPDELPSWLPGTLTVRSPEQGWGGVTVRGYRFGASDVEVPPLRDHVVVAYRRGTTIRRGVGGIWTTGTPGPGAVSLLTRAVASRWVWPDDIEVVHVYLPADVLARACRDMYDRDVRDVSLRDEVQADDPAIHRTALMLAQEADARRPGLRAARRRARLPARGAPRPRARRCRLRRAGGRRADVGAGAGRARSRGGAPARADHRSTTWRPWRD